MGIAGLKITKDGGRERLKDVKVGQAFNADKSNIEGSVFLWGFP
jgi:hypothetical protein